MARALGLDVGSKTIGVAASDELGMLAHPVTTVARQGVRKDCDKLMAIIKEREANVLVVGLPLELHGGQERSAKLARQVGDALAAQSGLRVVYVDERFSSVEAERRLIASGMRRDKRKAVIDQVAAQIILQGWLDHGEQVAWTEE